MPHRPDTLEARECYRVESTTVLPALPSRHDRLSNRWGLLLQNHKRRWCCCNIAGLSIGARERACGQPAFMPPTVHGRADSPAHGPVAPRRCGRSCSPRPRLPRFCCAGRTAAPVSFAHTRLAFGYPDHRLSAVDQQRAQIRVAVFLMPRSHCLPWRAAWGPIPARPPAAVHSTASINR